MRTLNRPMFRYGGPIKEGVMNGIREPKRNGGSMGNDPTGTGLVGDQRYPKTDGREHHWFTLAGTGAMAGIRALSGMAAKKAAQKIATSGAGTMGTGAASGAARSVPTIIGKNAAGAANAAKPGFFKSLFLDDPLVKAARYGYKALTGTGAKSLGQKAIRVAMSPSSIIAGTAYYMWPDGKERPEPPPEGSGGKKPGENSDMYQNKKPLTEAEIEAAEAAARKKKDG